MYLHLAILCNTSIDSYLSRIKCALYVFSDDSFSIYLFFCWLFSYQAKGAALLFATERKLLNTMYHNVWFKSAGNTFNRKGLIKSNELWGLFLQQPSQLVSLITVLSVQIRQDSSASVQIYIELQQQTLTKMCPLHCLSISLHKCAWK